MSESSQNANMIHSDYLLKGKSIAKQVGLGSKTQQRQTERNWLFVNTFSSSIDDFILKFLIYLPGKYNHSYFLNGKEVQMTSQLQYQNQVESRFFYNSENCEHNHHKLLG